MHAPGFAKYPDHEVKTLPLDAEIEIYFENDAIVYTNTSILLTETDCRPVLYIPKLDLKDVDLIKSGEYECPFKGKAEIYNLKHGTTVLDNAAWSYEEPYEEFQALKGHVAFYPNQYLKIKMEGNDDLGLIH